MSSKMTPTMTSSLTSQIYGLGPPRANCLGASDGDILKFNLGSPSNYSGITSFTYPSLTGGSGGKPKFGVLVRDRDLSYTITLSGDSGSTATSTESDGTIKYAISLTLYLVFL